MTKSYPSLLPIKRSFINELRKVSKEALSATVAKRTGQKFSSNKATNQSLKDPDAVRETEESIIQERLKTIVPDLDAAIASKGGKCMFLKPEVNLGGEQIMLFP